MAHNLGSLFDISNPKPSKPITEPRLTRQKSTAPSNQELDDLIFGERLEGPSNNRTPRHSTDGPTPATTTTTPSSLEAAATPPPPTTATTPPQSFWYPAMNRWRVLCATLVYFGNGLNDAAPGALLPYLETWYAIGYATVSLIFVTNAAGFLAAAFCTDAILTRLGRARTLILSECVMIAGYVVIVCTPPRFAGVVAAFFLLGYGAAINLALNNVFCANLRGSTVVLGLTHGGYGLGGTVGPVAATALAASGVVWSRFYLVALGIRVACVVFNAWAWWGHEREEEEEEGTTSEGGNSRAAAAAAGTPQQSSSKWQLLKQAFRNRVTLIGALFIFMYQGAEVSIAGWVISFLIHYRGGAPAQVGYVTAGFFVSLLFPPPPHPPIPPNLSPTGRHHPRPLPPHAPLPPRRRNPQHLRPHRRRPRLRPPRLARPQPRLRHHLRRPRRPPARPRLPLRPDRLLAPAPPQPPDHRRRLHRIGRLERRGRRAVFDGAAGAGGRDVGAASGLFGGVCGDGGVLGLFAEGGEEEGVRWGFVFWVGGFVFLG